MKLPRLHAILKTAWDTSGGNAVRRLIWSMWSHTVNGLAPIVNLWSTLTDLDHEARTELALLIELELDTRTAWLRELLEASGEWDRIDTHPPRFRMNGLLIFTISQIPCLILLLLLLPKFRR